VETGKAAQVFGFPIVGVNPACISSARW